MNTYNNLKWTFETASTHDLHTWAVSMAGKQGPPIAFLSATACHLLGLLPASYAPGGAELLVFWPHLVPSVLVLCSCLLYAKLWIGRQG
jgi:hypothetical protein